MACTSETSEHHGVPNGVHAFLCNYVQVYKRDYLGETAMHVATHYNSKEAMRHIVERDRSDPSTDGLHIRNK